MSKMFGTKNKALRKDGAKNKALVMKALRQISGAQVTATQIAQLVDEPISNSVILCWIRKLSAEGFCTTQGVNNHKFGQIIKVNE